MENSRAQFDRATDRLRTPREFPSSLQIIPSVLEPDFFVPTGASRNSAGMDRSWTFTANQSLQSNEETRQRIGTAKFAFRRSVSAANCDVGVVRLVYEQMPTIGGRTSTAVATAAAAVVVSVVVLLLLLLVQLPLLLPQPLTKDGHCFRLGSDRGSPL